MSHRRQWVAPPRILAVAITACALIAPSVQADSLFSSVGFGRWRHTTDARGAGLGDVSLASTTVWGSFSPGNPATLAYMKETAAYIGFESAITNADGGAGTTDTRSDSRLPLVAVGVPLFSKLVGGISFYELNDGRYHISNEIEGPQPYTLESKGEGAWTNVRFSLARSFDGERVRGSVGAQIGLPMSSTDESFTRDFDADGFVDRDEKHENVFRGAAFTKFGGSVEMEDVVAGAFVQLPSTGTLTHALLLGEDESREKVDLKIPAAFGLGISVPVTRAIRAFGEWRHQDWESLEIDGASWRDRTDEFAVTHPFETVNAWGAGVELTRGVDNESRSIRKHLVYRAGFSFTPWITQGPSLGRITDATSTLGLGIPFQSGNGMLDLALRYTVRREDGSDASEDVFGLVVGVGFSRQPRGF